MQINIFNGIEGAKKAKGIAVIVDVYRAASVAAYALAMGVKYIITVSTKEEAFSLKMNNPDYILMGESHGIKIEGFDLGNSPSEISGHNLGNKILVHRSSQGTQGLVNAINAEEIIFGSFPIMSAIANYIQEKNPDVISIVAMAGEKSEDGVFAGCLKDLLLGKKVDKEFVRNFLKNEYSSRFLDPNLIQFPIEDVDFCLDIDRFDFICKVKKENNQLRIYKNTFED